VHFRKNGGILDYEVPQMQRALDRLMDEKNHLLLRERHEQLMVNEVALRNEEIEEILNRRDQEY
jgi:hypothetical protein